MGDCSNGCGGCKPANNSKECKESCDDGCSCGCGSCDCDTKYALAYNLAMKNDGLKCIMCKNFYQYSLPNRCDGTLVCFKCKSTKSWQIPKGKWKK